MFSSIIRLGVAVSSAAILSSCGGSSVTETQQSTPEGVFTGTVTVPVTVVSLDGAVNTIFQSQSILAFVVDSGVYYAFYTATGSPSIPLGAAEGTFAFSGGNMTAADTENVTLPFTLSGGTVAGTVTNPSFTGAYNTGVNIAGTLSYPLSGATEVFNLSYNAGYQGVQDLGTLAGTYTGTVGSSSLSENATFTFSPATVPANSGNSFGVATITGTGASGCTYTGTVSPLYKGNGYTTVITSGASPCLLPGTEYTGLIYLNTTTNILYSYAPDVARTDGLIFVGTKI
jgi:hypothetical protein